MSLHFLHKCNNTNLFHRYDIQQNSRNNRWLLREVMLIREKATSEAWKRDLELYLLSIISYIWNGLDGN